MEPSEKIHDYANVVCGEIQWEKAHAVVSEEIENHLADQRDAYMADGADELAATDKAIAQMGDPIAVGIQLDRTHRPQPQWGMLAFAAIFICTGIVLNISGNWGFGYGWMLYLFIQLASGLAAMAAAFFFDFTWTGRYPRILLPLLMALFAAGIVISEAVGYSFLWEYNSLTLLLPLGFAGLVYSLRNKGALSILFSTAVVLIPVLLPFIAEVRWLRAQSVLYSLAAVVILCAAVSRGWFRISKRSGYWLVFLPFAVVLITALLIMAGNGRLDRIWNTFHLPYRGDGTYGWEGYFTETQAMLAGSKFIGHGVMPNGSAFSSGGGGLLTGWVFDSGWITVIPVFALLLLFFVTGFRLCFRQKSVLGLLVSVSVMTTLAMQIVCAVLHDFGIYLLSGLPLPLVFSSSPEFVVDMALAGLMLSVFRTGDVVRDRTIKKKRFVDAARV